MSFFIFYSSIKICRCLAAKGEESSECQRFAKYYRSLCPGEWVSAIAIKINFFLVCFDLAISSNMFGCIMVDRLNELYFVLFAQMMNWLQLYQINQFHFYASWFLNILILCGLAFLFYSLEYVLICLHQALMNQFSR